MKTLIYLLIFTLSVGLFAQDQIKMTFPENVSDEELITLSRDTSFAEAIIAIEVMSEKFKSKKIVNVSPLQAPIGIKINQMYWEEALVLLINMNNLAMKINPSSYFISDKIVIEEKIKDPNAVEIDLKQVSISATIFKADKSFTNAIGIDWSTLVNGEVSAAVNFKGANDVASDLITATIGTTFDAGNNIKININSMIKVLEANQKGSLLAKPNIIVLSGKKGTIQVGEDFSVKTTDDAGNVSDQFFSTGIILDVIPTIIEKDGEEAIHLITKVEKSAATPGEISTIITKSESSTQVLLFDGEETVIAGLYNTEENTTRNGIPFLKDLPWWFFGLRYLFGYNKIETSEKEMIIILKAEIVAPISVRRQEKMSTAQKFDDEQTKNKSIKTLFDDRKVTKEGK